MRNIGMDQGVRRGVRLGESEIALLAYAYDSPTGGKSRITQKTNQTFDTKSKTLRIRFKYRKNRIHGSPKKISSKYLK